MFVEARMSNRWHRRSAIAVAIVALIGLAGCGGEADRPAGSSEQATGKTPTGSPGESLGAPLSADATLDEALAHRDPLQRVGRVAQILGEATPDQLDLIKAAIEAAPLAWGDLEYALFAAWWARFDPSAAISYCEQELRLNHPRVVAEVLRMWGRNDPQAVIDSGWLAGRTIDGQGLYPDYVDPLVVGWFESGKPGLEDWIQGLDAQSMAIALGAYMRMKILRDGRGPALEWTRTAPFAPEVQRLLLGTGLNIVARQEPTLALEWLGRATKEGIDVRTFVARIGRGWAHREPREAMEWVIQSEVKSPDEKLRTVHDITRIWLNADQQGVDEWITARPADSWSDLIRRQAIAYHVTKNRYRVDWIEQMQRASTLANAQQRQVQYLWNIQRWKVIDPEAASKWLEENAELLGEHIQYVEQLPTQDRQDIEAAMAAERAAGKI